MGPHAFQHPTVACSFNFWLITTELLLLLLPHRNYSADATAFVVTFPIDSDPANKPAALAWEAGFIALANKELRDMAHAANLSFAFQAERWVWVGGGVRVGAPRGGNKRGPSWGQQSCHCGCCCHYCRCFRSVEDELKRESYTDASVVAISYLVMLGYITLALAALPPPSQILHVFVLSRAGGWYCGHVGVFV